MSIPGGNKSLAANLDRLACIIITYHPDLTTLTRQIAQIPPPCALVIVDNASSPPVLHGIEAITHERERFAIICNPTNNGLAKAINQGVRNAAARWPDVDFALLLDQDSIPQRGSIEWLLEQEVRFAQTSPPTACVGPSLFDPVTNLTHGFHRNDHWRWKRVYPDIRTGPPVQCDSLNGSGTLVRISVFRQLGGMDESLFIDHVDTEWSFRVLAAGYQLYGIPRAVFEHHMGDASRRIWLFGWRVWPMRPPHRHYYLYRNAVFLMRRNYVPGVWKTWAAIKLLFTAAVHLLIDPQRWAQLRNMFRGVRDGITTTSGSRPSNGPKSST